MRHWELEEHFARLIIGTLLILLVSLGLLLIGLIITSISPSGLIILSIGVIVLLTIGYCVGKWILG
jgi:hypothetical protein